MDNKYKRNYSKDGFDVDIIQEGALNLQVCSNAKDDELEKLTKIVNEMYLCGTTLGWVLSRREEVKPVQCQDMPDRRHFIFDC